MFWNIGKKKEEKKEEINYVICILLSPRKNRQNSIYFDFRASKYSLCWTE